MGKLLGFVNMYVVQEKLLTLNCGIEEGKGCGTFRPRNESWIREARYAILHQKRPHIRKKAFRKSSHEHYHPYDQLRTNTYSLARSILEVMLCTLNSLLNTPSKNWFRNFQHPSCAGRRGLRARLPTSCNFGRTPCSWRSITKSDVCRRHHNQRHFYPGLR